MNPVSLLARFGRFLRRVVTLRRVAFTAAALATVVAGFYIVENWRGERAWANAQARLRAAGEPLTLEEFLPTPPPDDQNFLMNPVFVRRFGFGKTEPSTPEPWEWEPGSNSPGSQESGSFPYEALGSVDGSTQPDLPALAASLPEPFAPDQPGTEREAAEAILRWTEQWQDDFAVLAVAVRERPTSNLPLRWTQDGLMEHWNAVESWIYGARLLHFRTLAQLAAGDRSGGLDSILIALRMAEASSADPIYFFNYVVSHATVWIIYQAIHDGLRRQIWSESDLQKLDQALARLDFQTDMRRALRGDRVYFNHMIDERTAVVRALLGPATPHNTFLANWCPRGWLRQNQAKAVDWQLEQQARLNQPFFERSKLVPFEKRSWTVPSSWWLSTWLHGTYGLESAMDEVDCRIRIARVALALEVHRLRHGEYPATWEQIVPALPPQRTQDPYVGLPLRYEFVAGRPKIWSVGPNQRDDRGREDTDGFDDIVWAYPVR